MSEPLFTCNPGNEPPLSDEDYRVARDRYFETLRAADLSDAGDLLRYFGLGFFHDSAMSHLCVDLDAQRLSFRASSLFVEVGEHQSLTPYPEFDVLFQGVVHLEWRRVGRSSQRIFIDSEIDGRADLIASAQDAYGGRFHSLAIDAYGEEFVILLRSARVTPRDPARWARILGDPTMHVQGLFE